MDASLTQLGGLMGTRSDAVYGVVIMEEKVPGTNPSPHAPTFTLTRAKSETALVEQMLQDARAKLLPPPIPRKQSARRFIPNSRTPNVVWEPRLLFSSVCVRKATQVLLQRTRGEERVSEAVVTAYVERLQWKCAEGCTHL